MLLASICYGFAGHFTKRFLSNTSIMVITTFTLLTGAVIGLIGMLRTEPIKPGMLMEPLTVFRHSRTWVLWLWGRPTDLFLHQ
ncbi:hypothetical protein RCO48_19455 [Peribacillus frigoritolerans]|nr:hypothetical protein [Peribacillus frigoritolerans]